MSISEQVKYLREFGCCCFGTVRQAILEAADTIESLSAKLQAVNEELERWHTDHVNEKIKNPFAYTSTLICHNCDHKDEYIEELEAEVEELKAANMERSAEDCGGWILCKDRLPDNNRQVICCFKSGIVTALVFLNHKFHSTAFSYESSDIIAWQPLPEPCR